jgi:hypothetical protein
MEERILTGIIYKITSPSGKVYVGQTIQEFNIRIKSHHRKDSGCTAISRAIQKYKDQMKYEIIEDNVPQEQLDDREIYWIKKLNSLAPNGYNLNTGGQFFQITEEVKDRLRGTQNRLAIEKNGYLGTVHQNSSNTFTPVINNNTVYAFLSKGGFATKEEAIEVLKEYTKDPENFEKVEGTIQRTIGSVYKNSPNKWAASYKKEHLGHYYSKKEAEEALERYLKDPKNFVKPDKKVGSVYKRGNKWGVNYKGKYIATYDTQYEAQEALERYLRDPENFVKPRRRVGCVYKKYNKWVVLCKGNRLGSYDTQQEAENVLSMYIAQSSIYTSSSESS